MHTAEDVVASLIEKLLTERRKWERDKHPDFKNYFFMLITSHVRNLAKKEKKYYELNEFDEDDEPIEAEIQDDDCTEIGEQIESEELIEKCEKALEGNDEELLVFWNILKDYKGNKEVAEDLGIGVDDVVNVKKRIKRKITPIIQNHFMRKEVTTER